MLSRFLIIFVMGAALSSAQADPHRTGRTKVLSTVPTTQPARVPELLKPRFTYSEAVGLGYDKEFTRRDPSDVIKVGDTYYVWYTKTPHGHSGYNATVWYATSKDGHTWTEKAEAVPRGGPGTWDEASVFTPGILVFDDKYYLFYTAIPRHEVLDTTPTAIGIAVSDSPDGPWTRIDSNPVLLPSKDPNHFDSFRVDDACLLVRNNRCWLYYKGRQQDRSPKETKMGIAIADKPTGPYIRIPGNPVVRSGHEVLSWPHRAGVATLIGWAGPDKNTLQYAPDGVHFARCAQAKQPPKAPGAYRPDAFTNATHARGITWGISMKPRPRPHLIRYDCNLAVENK